MERIQASGGLYSGLVCPADAPGAFSAPSQQWASLLPRRQLYVRSGREENKLSTRISIPEFHFCSSQLQLSHIRIPRLFTLYNHLGQSLPLSILPFTLNSYTLSVFSSLRPNYFKAFKSTLTCTFFFSHINSVPHLSIPHSMHFFTTHILYDHLTSKPLSSRLSLFSYSRFQFHLPSLHFTTKLLLLTVHIFIAPKVFAEYNSLP